MARQINNGYKNKVKKRKTLKRIRTVKKAKKFLKEEMDILHPSRKRNVMVRWDKKMNSFLVETIHGQRIRVFDIYKN